MRESEGEPCDSATDFGKPNSPFAGVTFSKASSDSEMALAL